MTDQIGPCVLALGFFDGVHRGHAALLRQAVLVSEREGIPSAVMTFDTHPDTLVRGEPVELINSAPDRAWLIRHYFHIDRVEFFRFTEDTMRTPWRTFLDSIRSELGAVHFVVGYDFRFGWRGEGTAALLRDYCRENALGCDIIDPVVLDGITVSSTYIRGLLKAGNMREAERFMGHPHILSDMVRHGRALGRKLGAPTVNMRFAPGVLIPRYGVYATKAHLREGVFAAVTNIGVRPTVSSDNTVSVESHLLDYSGNLYGRPVLLEFVEHIRDEIAFSSVDELSAQISADTERARSILEAHI
ncbi:MAG: bifunctional riboflavin kinase/FAD synthetase [Oscillospiraceae bacterium]|nr:bifunctional riboflavin kinase/FAD synthetase [Oscillospiraceae bacterium]